MYCCSQGAVVEEPEVVEQEEEKGPNEVKKEGGVPVFKGEQGRTTERRHAIQLSYYGFNCFCTTRVLH